jgi:hypothetical protein
MIQEAAQRDPGPSVPSSNVIEVAISMRCCAERASGFIIVIWLDARGSTVEIGSKGQ